MCLVCRSCTGLEPMKIDPWLSPQIGIALCVIPSSRNNDFIHTACQLVSDSAIYSASVDDKATVFCTWDFQLKMLLANVMVCARSRSFQRTIKGWLWQSLRWWLPHHCSVPPLPLATLVGLILELRWNTSSTLISDTTNKSTFLSLPLPTSTMCYSTTAQPEPHHAHTHSMSQANHIAHTPVLEVMGLSCHKDLWGFESASFGTLRSKSLFIICSILKPYALLTISLYVYVLSLDFRRRYQVRSRARHWLQLVGCTALLMDALNFGGLDGVGESGVEPRRSLRKARAS